MPDKSNPVLEEAVDPVKAQQQLNLIQYKRALARRNFIKNVSLAGAGIAAGVILEGCGSSNPTVSAQTVPQTDVLNFALNLEYLEAEFYSQAVYGKPLSSFLSTLPSSSATATGGKQVNFALPHVKDIATEIQADEVDHVKYLLSALGGMAVAEPNINLAALGIGFNADADFLTLARAFEDTGVSAYAGAATLLSGNNLQAAAQILATEAYHAGNIRLECVENSITTPATDSQDVPPTEQHFFTTDSNGLAIKRTTSQVLMIVYATTATGVSNGGFYPNGMNGNIKTT